MRHRVGPLGESRAACDVVGARRPAFGKNKESGEEIERAEGGGDVPGCADAKGFVAESAEGRTEDEAEAKSHSDEAHFLRALFGRSDVRNVGLGDGDICAADA